jgi:hypothetical protein
MKPRITPEDRDKYSITQVIADIVRRQEYDGIRFPSSAQSGHDLCVFQTAAFSYDPTSGRVLYVPELKYRTKRLIHLTEGTKQPLHALKTANKNHASGLLNC